MKNENNCGGDQEKDRQNASFEKFKKETKRIYRDLFHSEPPNVRAINESHVHHAGHSSTQGW